MKRIKYFGYLLALLATLQLSWVFGMGWIIDSGRLHQWLNAKPEKFTVQWEQLDSTLPFMFSGSGLRMTSQNARVQSHTEIGEFSFAIAPWKLLVKELRLSSVEITHVNSKIRPARMLRNARPDSLAFFPEIAGFKPFALDAPEFVGPLNRRWRIIAPGFSLGGDFRIWVGNYRLKATGLATGAFSYRLGGEFKMGIDSIETTIEHISVNGHSLVNELTVEGKAEFMPFAPYYYPGRSRLEFLNLNVMLKGQIADLQFLNFYLLKDRNGQWPGLQGDASMQGRLVLAGGVPVEPTQVELDSSRISFLTDHFGFSSKGHFSLITSKADSDTREIFRFLLDELAFTHIESNQALLKAKNINISLKGTEFSLATPLDQLAIDASVDNSEVPDVSVINSMLPAKLQTRVAPGKGYLSGNIRWADKGMQGAVSLKSENIGFNIRNRNLFADIDFRLNLAADIDSRNFSIAGSKIDVKNARLRAAGENQSPWNGSIDIHEGDLYFVSGEELPKLQSGLRNVLEFSNGSLQLEGNISDIGLINHIVTVEKRLRISGGGHFRLDLGMQEGFIGEGSFMEYEAPKLSAKFLDFNARGAGKLRGEFRLQDNNRYLFLTTAINQVDVSRVDTEQELLHAPNVVFHVIGRAPDVMKPLEDIDVNLQINDARIPDITVYNSYLPKGGTIRFLQGRGVLNSRFNLDEDDTSGQIEINAPKVLAEVNGTPVKFNFAMLFNLLDGKLETRKFKLRNSYIRLDQLEQEYLQSDVTDWQAMIRFPDGTLTWKTPLRMESRAELEMSSSGPLVELMIGQEGYSRWLRKMITVRDVTGNALLQLQPDNLVVNNMNIKGESIQVAAKLKFAKEKLKGVVYNRLGRLAATVTVDGEERDWHLLSAGDVYNAYPAF